MPHLTGILLAAGQSLRMGEQDKLQLPYQGKPMVCKVIDHLLESEIDAICIVTGIEKATYSDAYQMQTITYAHNPDYATGMTSSIQAGVQTATDTDGYMICLADQPTIPSAVYNTIIRAFHHQIARDPGAIVVPNYKGKRGNPVVFSAHYRQSILDHREPEGCRSIVRTNKTHIYSVEVASGSILQDVDTPEDYLRLNNANS